MKEIKRIVRIVKAPELIRSSSSNPVNKLECEKVNEDAEAVLGANVTEPINIRTSNSESTCGIELTVDNVYKIMGQATSDGEILVFLCNYVKQIEPALP